MATACSVSPSLCAHDGHETAHGGQQEGRTARHLYSTTESDPESSGWGCPSLAADIAWRPLQRRATSDGLVGFWEDENGPARGVPLTSDCVRIWGGWQPGPTWRRVPAARREAGVGREREWAEKGNSVVGRCRWIWPKALIPFFPFLFHFPISALNSNLQIFILGFRLLLKFSTNKQNIQHELQVFILFYLFIYLLSYKSKWFWICSTHIVILRQIISIVWLLIKICSNLNTYKLQQWIIYRRNFYLLNLYYEKIKNILTQNLWIFLHNS
jgi:hypothetical protein